MHLKRFSLSCHRIIACIKRWVDTKLVIISRCPFLHRTAGDTERRYHLRYYKTCMCVHDTDARGYCVKNGPHCAFAHGDHDLRPPVYDIKELQALESQEGDGSALNGPNVLDKERNSLLNEDPKWQGKAAKHNSFKWGINKYHYFFQIADMFWLITRLSNVKGRQDCVGRDMLVRNITILRIKGVIRRNSNIGTISGGFRGGGMAKFERKN